MHMSWKLDGNLGFKKGTSCYTQCVISLALQVNYYILLECNATFRIQE